MDMNTNLSSAQIDSNASGALRRSTEERRQEIVLTVLALAGEIGVDAITTQAIAERMGLTQGAVFRHFPNKEAIWSAVLDWLETNLDRVYQPEPHAAPLSEVRRVFDAYMEMFQRYPAVPRLFFCDTFHHPYPALHARMQRLVAWCEGHLNGWLGQAVADGTIRAGLDTRVAAKLLLAGIQGLAFQTCILGIVNDPVAEGRPILDLYLAGLGAGKEVA